MSVSPAASTPPETRPADEANAMGERGSMDEPTPGGYGYGPPPTMVRDTNYVSDENLLVWLAQKQDGIYGDLRDRMDMSRARSKLMADLSNLKAHVDAGMGPSEAKAELERLLAAYEGTDFEGELNDLLAVPLAEIRSIAALPDASPGKLLTDDFLERLSSEIESKVDALGRDDQLELIEIQSLTADAREAAQLASNLLSSSNQASNTIVGNIAR